MDEEKENEIQKKGGKGNQEISMPNKDVITGARFT